MVEPRYGFNIMVENIRGVFRKRSKRSLAPLKIGGERFHDNTGRCSPESGNGGAKMGGSPVLKIVARDRGKYRMP